MGTPASRATRTKPVRSPEHDAIPLTGVAIGLEVPAGIHEHLSPHGQRAQRVRRTCADGAKALQDSAGRRDLPHGEVVGECVERRLDAADVQQRAKRAREIGSGDAAVVVRHVEGRTRGDVLESIPPQPQIAAIEALDRRQHAPNQLGIAEVESVGVEPGHASAIRVG